MNLKKNLSILLTAGLLLASLPALAQKKADMRAKQGEDVWLIINYVKDEAKADYEAFMADTFFALLQKSKNEKTRQQYQQTRYLKPARQNEDGTWTYIFLMDPVVEDGNYDIPELFMEVHSEEEAQKLMEQYESFMARPAEFHGLLQSEH
ncbi:MAG: hypothetical protein J5I94_26430 [Phaeodactylibacter sp.]|nr:hypothetical protein [Phaeodactylibacter sp.]